MQKKGQFCQINGIWTARGDRQTSSKTLLATTADDDQCTAAKASAFARVAALISGARRSCARQLVAKPIAIKAIPV
jgi:hypothetical protein